MSEGAWRGALCTAESKGPAEWTSRGPIDCIHRIPGGETTNGMRTSTVCRGSQVRVGSQQQGWRALSAGQDRWLVLPASQADVGKMIRGRFTCEVRSPRTVDRSRRDSAQGGTHRRIFTTRGSGPRRSDRSGRRAILRDLSFGRPQGGWFTVWLAFYTRWVPAVNFNRLELVVLRALSKRGSTISWFPKRDGRSRKSIPTLSETCCSLAAFRSDDEISDPLRGGDTFVLAARIAKSDLLKPWFPSRTHEASKFVCLENRTTKQR